MTSMPEKQTEYQRQFTWKGGKGRELVSKVDISELTMDHLNQMQTQTQTNKTYDFQWQSEYKREFCSKDNSPNHVGAGTMTELNLVDDSAQTTDEKIAGVRFTADEKENVNRVIKGDKSDSADASQQTSLVRVHSEPSQTNESQPLQPLGPQPRPQQNQQTHHHKVPTSTTQTTTSNLKPVMAQYGQGNIHPTVPQLHMKTFNVRAPKTEVYPHTMERNLRIKHFDESELHPPHPSITSPSTLPDPARVLRQYADARDIVRKVQASFRSEYARQFVDWAQPWDKVKRDLGFDEGIVVDHAQMSVAGIPSGDHTHRKIVGIQSGDHADAHEMLARAPVKRTWEGGSGGHASFSNPSVFGGVDRVEKRIEKLPLDLTRVQSIYQDLKKKKKKTDINFTTSTIADVTNASAQTNNASNANATNKLTNASAQTNNASNANATNKLTNASAQTNNASNANATNKLTNASAQTNNASNANATNKLTNASAQTNTALNVTNKLTNASAQTSSLEVAEQMLARASSRASSRA